MKLGLIGGTSLVKFAGGDEFAACGLDVVSMEDVVVDTEYGPVPVKKINVTGAGAEHTIFFMQRHHTDMGMTPPHKINHHANLRALANCNVDAILTVCSVGTIATSFPPGRVGAARQYIDFTGVPITFHDNDAKFTSVTQPFNEAINHLLVAKLRETQELSAEVRMLYTYWLAAGPHYETEAEVDAIDRLGGEVVGMTMPRECKLAAELGIPYNCLLVSSNWAAGRTPGDKNAVLSHSDVSQVANKRVAPVWACIIDVVMNYKA